MVSGLRSVGKSSFVCALWGDAGLLPTAVRDCTQSNTVVRIPRPGETDRTIRLDYLPRERALEFATRGLAFHRIAQMLDETLGPIGPRLDEGPAEARLHNAIAAVKQLFAQRRDLAVLYEPLTEQLEQLEEFLAFLDSPDYRPGETVTVAWERRQEYLMGLRRDDGRSVGLGKLLALRAVEVLRESTAWGAAGTMGNPALPPPRLVDTPWVPTFHNARRAELVVEQARAADVVIVLALPEILEPEDWLQAVLKDQPGIGARTLVVFNQIDTIDPLSLYRRDGFAEAFQKNADTLGKLGIPPANLCISCARLPFLRGSAPTPDINDRLRRLEKALRDVRQAAGSRTDSALRPLLLEATGESDTLAATDDGGLTAFRHRLTSLLQTQVLPARARTALTAIVNLTPAHLPADFHAPLARLQYQARERLSTLPR